MNQRVQGSTNGWWDVRFRIKWPKNETPSWHVDLLLAHRIISPILCQQKNDIALWRFHRRAKRPDKDGHEFKFAFYSSPKIARRIYRAIKADTLLKEMRGSRLINRVAFDKTNTIAKPNIEDSGEKHWDTAIQKSWPYFAMGASEMWLILITEIANPLSAQQNPASLPEFLSLYQQVNARVQELWQKQELQIGQGEGYLFALHHLNAIFGYEPVLVPLQVLVPLSF